MDEAQLAELKKIAQKTAGYKADRCVCVFGPKEDPVIECDYHKALRAEVAELKCQLAETQHWLESRQEELKTVQDQLITAYADLAMAIWTKP